MWCIFKIDKKKINCFKKDLQSKLGDNVNIYLPKVLVQKYKNNKLISKEFNLLGDYIFCYHSKFNSSKIYDLIKFTRGLKTSLPGSIICQNEINDFINRCKSSENDKGYITNSFFGYHLDINYKFRTGPMTEKLFKIIEIQKNKLKILLGDYKTTILKKKYLYDPI